MCIIFHLLSVLRCLNALRAFFVSRLLLFAACSVAVEFHDKWAKSWPFNFKHSICELQFAACICSSVDFCCCCCLIANCELTSRSDFWLICASLRIFRSKVCTWQRKHLHTSQQANQLLISAIETNFVACSQQRLQILCRVKLEKVTFGSEPLAWVHSVNVLAMPSARRTRTLQIASLEITALGAWSNEFDFDRAAHLHSVEANFWKELGFESRANKALIVASSYCSSKRELSTQASSEFRTFLELTNEQTN